MKKFILSTSVLIVFILYSIHLHSGDEEGTQAIISNTTPTNSVAGQNPAPTPIASSSPPIPTKVATPKPSGKYRDGTYTGSVADAFYGNIQVKAIISGGRITDVIFLQYPSDRSTSIEINSQAMPFLKQEAIQAQSAQVAGVSGATASSGAFIESLGNALQQAL
jgi:uncharacterized protein with FMN-binding domain